MIIKMSEYLNETNASASFKEAVANAQNGDTLYFDIKGEYHFYKEFSESRKYHMTNTDSFKFPVKYYAMIIEDKSDLVIDGNGSTFVIHGDVCALALIRCKNIKLINFRITYKSPTNFEMTVADKKLNKIKYQMPEDSLFYIEGKNLTYYEESPYSNEKYYSYTNNKKAYCNVIHRENEVFRTTKSPLRGVVNIKKTDLNVIECSYIIPPRLKIGDTIALSRNLCRDNSGIFFWECKDIDSENLTVNYLHGFGWLSQMCENLNFKDIKFTPDFDRGYKVSSFADLIHICGCKGRVNIDKCLFEHPHDDGINIHGAFLRLKEVVNDNTAVFEFVHKQQGGYKCFFSGDKVKFYSRLNLAELDGIYTVKSTDDDIDNKLVTVTFEEKLPKMTPLMVVAENITYTPSVKITNCIFRNIPTRGILLTTLQKSEIAFNTFESLKMPDIYISCDCRDWYESGPCKDLAIHDNKFSQPNPVKLDPICLGKAVSNVHENIRIYDNN